MCMNRRLPPPTYEVGMEKGAPHERSFVIVCSVGGNFTKFLINIYFFVKYLNVNFTEKNP